jgi:chorismate-pyruvate lyase
MPVIPESRAAAAHALDLLMPLAWFYNEDDAPLPPVHFMEGSEVPQPWRDLLVHQCDMTPTLRAHHGSEITLQVVQMQMSDSFVMRQVVLHRASDGVPVEFGAIGIQLENFPPHVKELIREGQRPLGGILETEGVPHTSAPRAWFSVEADDHIGQLLKVHPGTKLYGRCNALSHPDGIVFADIVEILPP